MKTEITNTGDGNVVNTGDNSNVNATINITKGNKEQLNKELENIGIEKEDIQELNLIVDEETPDYQSGRLGEKANNWIGKMFGKGLNGLGKISTGMIANVLATLIKQYYGIHN